MDRVGQDFHISPQTASADHRGASALCPRAGGEPAPFKVERWDFHELHVAEIAASANLLIIVAKAAFKAAAEQYPGARLTLRQGIRVIEKTD
jgi:hypothetical protein